MAKSNDGDGWVGWVAFAALMLYVLGALHIIAGLVALFKDTNVYTGASNVWILDYTKWGWIHIVGGLFALWGATSLAQGKLFGRILAALVAFASLVANFAFVPVYPVWSILIIVIDVVIIYAVTVHGGDMKELE